MTNPPARPQEAQQGPSKAPQGERPAARPATPSQPAQGPGTITNEQKAHLATHAKRGQATTSQARSFLWAHLLNLKQPIGTKELSQAQAATLITDLQKMTNDVIDASVVAAFNRLGDDLPF